MRRECVFEVKSSLLVKPNITLKVPEDSSLFSTQSRKIEGGGVRGGPLGEGQNIIPVKKKKALASIETTR